jgi:hypothetical protein
MFFEHLPVAMNDAKIQIVDWQSIKIGTLAG